MVGNCDWFETPFGLKQGDILSTTRFAMFVNDLALQMKVYVWITLI